MIDNFDSSLTTLGCKLAPNVKLAMVVPGSGLVKRQVETSPVASWRATLTNRVPGEPVAAIGSTCGQTVRQGSGGQSEKSQRKIETLFIYFISSKS